MKKRVGIDFHVIDGKYQGSRTHVQEIFSRAIALDTNIEYYLFLEKIDILSKISSAFTLPNVNLIYMRHMNPMQRLCIELPKMQKKYSLDLLHTQYITPIPSYSPCVVTIHDILFETHPQYFKWFFIIRSKILMRLSAHRSLHIFTVSEYSKQQITQRYGIKADKISVINNGVDQNKYYPGISDEEIITKRGLKSGEYLLTVGRIEPRKNHITLLKAYAMLGSRVPPLVIIGQKDFRYGEVFNSIDILNLKERVIIMDDVRDDELSALYRHAKIFIYPSWAEGFGVPPLEAMSSGVPVICSNTTAIPEVAGDAACLMDPGNPQQIAFSIKKILKDKKMQKKMRECGLVQAEEFVWEKAAKKTVEVYKNVFNV